MAFNVFNKGGGGGKKADLYSAFLRSEGYPVEVDQDGDLTFKKEGGTFVLFANEEDREYFSILFPNIWPIESEKERTLVYQAAAHATAITKCAKVFPVGDNVSVSVELIFEQPEQVKPLFSRALMMIRAAVENFAKQMKELG